MWSEPIERAQSKPKGYGSPTKPESDPNSESKPEPTREEFLKAIGYRLDGTHVSDGKAYSK
jgi:hypothetical protein